MSAWLHLSLPAWHLSLQSRLAGSKSPERKEFFFNAPRGIFQQILSSAKKNKKVLFSEAPKWRLQIFYRAAVVWDWICPGLSLTETIAVHLWSPVWVCHQTVVSEHDTFVCVLCVILIPEKSRICDLFILFNFYLIDKRTKKRFPKFSLTNVNVFCEYEQI